MVPSAFVALPALPLTSNGKVDRRALPVPDVTRPELGSEFVAARTPTEETLGRIWCDILGLEDVGIRDDFFELGGHSLLVLRMWSQVGKAFGKHYPLNVLYYNSTIEKLAAALGLSDASDSASSPTPLAPTSGGTGPVLFCPDLAAIVAKHLDDVPIYPLDFFTHDRTDWDSIVEMAADYIGRMRHLQREGPYQLGGFCGNGVVLFEMARQLREQGQEVSLLILIDPKSIGTPPRPRFFRLRHLVYRMRHHRTMLRAAPKSSWPRYFSDRFSAILRKVARQYNPSIPQDEVVDFLSDRPQMKRAMMSYQPGSYEGRVTLFMAKGRVDLYGDKEFGWGSVSGGGLDVRVIPGDHSTIRMEPNVRVMAEEIRSCVTGRPRRSPPPP